MTKKTILTTALILGLGVTALASTKARWKAGVLEYFESTTQETVSVLRPVVIYDEFIGAATAIPVYTDTTEVGIPWRTRSGANTTVAINGAAVGGVLDTRLSTADGAEQVSVYFADKTPLKGDKLPGFSFNANLSKIAIATGGTAEVNIGISGVYAAGTIGSANFIGFRYADTEANWQALVVDTEGTQSKDTGIPVVAGKAHEFRVELYDFSNIIFFIDGADVAVAEAASVATQMQPHIHMYKPGATTEVRLEVDYFRAWQNR